MWRTIGWVSAVASLLGAAPAAQDVAEQAHKTLVLRGCLVAGPNEATFRLANASRVETESVQPKPGGRSVETADYEIRGEVRVGRSGVGPEGLRAYVGQQVEVTGRPFDDPPVTLPQSEPADKQSAVLEGPTRPERLTATTIKPIAASCR